VWHIGKPDLIMCRMDGEHHMYSEGSVWWIDYFADITLDEDRYIKAMEIKRANRRIVHHVGCTSSRARRASWNTGNRHQPARVRGRKYGDTFQRRARAAC